MASASCDACSLTAPPYGDALPQLALAAVGWSMLVTTFVKRSAQRLRSESFKRSLELGRLPWSFHEPAQIELCLLLGEAERLEPFDEFTLFVHLIHLLSLARQKAVHA